MLLSVFTPTHDTRYLMDAYRSLKIQQYQNFEWIIAPNCKEGTSLPELPSKIAQDSRVVCAPLIYHDKPLIGALKAHCCRRATGDVFVELDHDDMLIPGVLAEIALQVSKGADFVYSDTAVFSNGPQIVSQVYDERWGWETYDFRVYGKKFTATRSFEITARSLC